jgi:hypothetical protein
MPRVKRNRQGSSSRRRRLSLHDLPAHIKSLSEDAPLGAYLVDTVAQELFPVASFLCSPTAFIRLIRQGISSSATYAIMAARIELSINPKWLHLTVPLFRNLSKLQAAIHQSKILKPLTLSHSIKQIQSSRSQMVGTDQIERDLPSALQLVCKLIGDQLRCKPQQKPGHHDPFTRTFIDQIFKLWCDHVWSDPLPRENRLFVRLIAAAWLDLCLPTQDHTGVRLEDWLNDRVRKQFPNGIRSSRLSRQERITFNRTNMSAVTNAEQ